MPEMYDYLIVTCGDDLWLTLDMHPCNSHTPDRLYYLSDLRYCQAYILDQNQNSKDDNELLVDVIEKKPILKSTGCGEGQFAFLRAYKPPGEESISVCYFTKQLFSDI